MYLPFFGLSEKPFAITPDPRYLFLGERHAEALAHLVYGITEAGGFIQLTGEVGTGKTTIIRSLLARQPDNAEIALILNPGMTAPEFLLTICEELGIMVPNDAVGSVKDLVDILNHYLLKAHARGKRVVLVIDEAQGLSPELLEQVRLLTNLETDTQKLLQIILIGQPELRDLLARNDLRQLAQRVTGRYHLDPLSRSESAAYVKHRLRIAGATVRHLHGWRAVRTVPRQRRNTAPAEHHQRPCAARWLHRRPSRDHRRHGAARGIGSVRQAPDARVAALGAGHGNAAGRCQWRAGGVVAVPALHTKCCRSAHRPLQSRRLWKSRPRPNRHRRPRRTWPRCCATPPRRPASMAPTRSCLPCGLPPTCPVPRMPARRRCARDWSA